MREHMVPFLGPHGFNRVACFEWGDPASKKVLICVHGLTRRGRDFDFLAQAVKDRYRVICPDMPGRGLSDWLADKNDYDYLTYCAAAAAVIVDSGAAHVDWVGTSMGGLIGLMVAAQPNTPIRRMVINDVGPFLPKAALERIGSYVGTDPRYEQVHKPVNNGHEVGGSLGGYLMKDKLWFFSSYSPQIIPYNRQTKRRKGRNMVFIDGLIST